MNQTVYIHIGMPKTGSSAIQAFLTLNIELLKKNSISFPDPPKFTQAYQTSAGNASAFHQLIIENKIDIIKNIIDKQLNNTNNNLIISSEMLYHTIAISPENFFNLFKNFNYKIICYVRRQDELFSSSYNQLVKNHNIEEIDLTSLENNCNFSTVLLNCLRFTEKENIIVRPYEKQQFYNGDIYSDFLNLLGLELTVEYIMPEKIVNPSLNRDALEFRKLINGFKLSLNNNEINKLLAEYSVREGAGLPFTPNNIFSPKQRYEFINKYAESNSKIAEIFLGRTGGELFYELPDLNEEWEPYKGLSPEVAIEICKFILQNYKYSNEKNNQEITNIILKNIVKSVIEEDYYRKEEDSRLRSQVKNLKNQVLYKKEFKKANKIYSDFKKNIGNIGFMQDIDRISLQKRKVEIFAIGKDPHFKIPNFSNSTNFKRIYIKTILYTEEQTELQVFFSTSVEPTFHFDQCETYPLNKGVNEIYLILESDNNIVDLRLDPGMIEGKYIVYEFEVRG